MKQCSQCSQRFCCNRSESNHHHKRSQIYHFSSGQGKQHIEYSQRFHLNSSGQRQRNEPSQCSKSA